MSIHSIERAKERKKYNREQAVRLIARARERGKSYNEFYSREKEYLYKKEVEQKHSLYYAGYCFIFSADYETCITLFEVPSWFGRKIYYNGKEVIRKPRTYRKYYPKKRFSIEVQDDYERKV